MSRVLVLGLGGAARCTLPLLFEHLPLPPSAYTVLDPADDPAVAAGARDIQARGACFARVRITRENYAQALAAHLGPGDLLLDLAWNLGTLDLLQWCRDSGVLYVNASLEVWDPYAEGWSEPPAARTLYRRHLDLRDMLARWGANDGPTAVLDHGANPGLVSHFTKVALLDIAQAWLSTPSSTSPSASPSTAPSTSPSSLSSAAAEPARREQVGDAAARRSWNELARALDVQVIHVSERDTQISSAPKRVNEFVNTWSVEGFYEEGVAPAEMGWGTHERTLPAGAHLHATGPGNQICLARPGCRTWVRSWVPSGDITGMVIRHGEAFSISDTLTVVEDGEPVYRPTVHYAYCPSDAAIASLHELHMRGYELQRDQRILGDDIVAGADELGVLLMGHPLTGWWTGSLLDIGEARRLVPHQNATTLQVAAAVLGAVRWMLDNPRCGVRLPDELPHEEILAAAMPYLGPFLSRQVDWTPLRSWRDPFAGHGSVRPLAADVWQFGSFLVRDGS
ncbi:MAG: saccharopine dehydrogenase NADP-binding domain-containing protein [Actinomycetota bacterium]|nr:saccharopine dehydrogenase NADP-binding domain-containing protein [Actinomycetota bacterium]MDP9460753.1 saccharopine dehydrogenase NADP-binding domain-containing protein [Actinomycetota bacterium]